MIGKISRRLPFLFAALLAIPVVLFIGAGPAAAINNGRMCEVSGNYCLGSADFSLYTPVTERNPGRDLSLNELTGTFEGHFLWQLAFANATSQCVAAANNPSDVNIKACSGGTGNVWAVVVVDGSHYRWINRLATQQAGHDMYLSGKNSGGSQ